MTTETTETKTDKPRIAKRFIACTQSTGRVGKSFCAEGIISALRYQGVAITAIDADRQHQTLSRRHPKDVELFDATRSLDDFSLMLQSLPNAPVLIVDFPAQATGFLLDASKKLQLMEFFELQGIRPTFLVFMADDSTARESAAGTVRFFGDRADYLLVENSARFRSAMFKKTPFYKWFQDRSTPTLVVPHVTSPTMDAWEAIERKIGQYLTLDEVRSHLMMHDLCRLELDYVRNRFLVQCEDFADRLLPDVSLLKNKVSRPKEMQTVAIEPLTDEFFA